MRCRVLLIEDDFRLASSIVQYMELQGVNCDHCHNGEQARNLLTTNTYDVLVSDINMPRMSGFDLCLELRRMGIDSPVIMISSRTSLEDKVKGFEVGTDDYLVKPFELKELLIRVNALSKRKSGQSTSMVIEELELTINFSQHRVTRSGVEVVLSKSGWILMAALARAWPNPVKKEELEFLLWGDQVPNGDGLKVHIHHLRQRLAESCPMSILQSVRGYGFKLALSDD
jgi:DNA-binding response OmpR family regulator